MSRETLFKTKKEDNDDYFWIGGVEMNTEYDAKDKLEEAEHYINYAKQKIIALCAATPADMFKEETFNSLMCELKELFELYEDNLDLRTKCWMTINNKDILINQNKEE